MLYIRKDGNVFLDEERVNFSNVSKREFIIANLWNEIQIDDGVILEDMIHLFYEIREFVYEYFSEYYESTRALITMGQTNEFYSAIKFFKAATLEELDNKKGEFFFIGSNVEFTIEEEGSKTQKVGKLPVILSDVLIDEQKILTKKVNITFTLMDVMILLFDEIPHILKTQSLLS